MAKIRKCPRCGEDVIGDYCFSCGYEMPAEAVREAAAEEHRTQQSVDTTDYIPPVYPKIKVYDDNSSYNKYTNNNYNNCHEKPKSSFLRFTERYMQMTFGEKVKNYWWYMLLALFVPGLWLMPGLVGVITALSHNDKPSKIFAGEQIILAVIGLLIFG
jgi:hypothetical protein